MQVQDIAVYFIVMAAAGFLVRNYWMSSQGKKGCGSCGSGGCGKKTAAKPVAQPNLIQITLQKPAGAGGQGGIPMNFRPVEPDKRETGKAR